MLAFWGDNKALAVRRSVGCIIKNEMRHSNRAVKQSLLLLKWNISNTTTN